MTSGKTMKCRLKTAAIFALLVVNTSRYLTETVHMQRTEGLCDKDNFLANEDYDEISQLL